MKKGIIALVCVLVLGPTFVCANGSAEQPTSVTPTAVELSLWHYFAGEDGPVFTKYVEQFNQEFKGKIHVNEEFVPRNELLKQYTIGAVSGDLPDIGMIDNPDQAAYASMGILADVTDKYNAWDGAHFLDEPISSCTYEGRIYGLPAMYNCLALFYDKDMLAAAGVTVPKTWSELEAACAKLTDHSKGRYGLAMSADRTEEGTFQFIPFVESSGKFDQLDSAGSIESLAYLTRLVNEGYMSKEIINWTQGDAEKQFASGSAAMMINGPWNIPGIRADAPDKNWSVALIPRADEGVYASCLGGENFAICKGPHVDASWTFLSWFCGKDISTKYNYEIKKISPRSDVDNQKIYADDPIMALFASVMPTAKQRGPHPRWPEISSAIYTAEQEALTGQKTPAQAMKDAQAKIDKINAGN